MVELLFNLVWLGIAILSVVVWLRARARDQYAPGAFRSLLLLTCVLVFLLFPAVSATDDLHAPLDVVEQLSASARKAHLILLLNQDYDTPQLPSALAAPCFSLVERISQDEVAIPQSASVVPSISRAPPAA